jgi:hypothetical protein
MLWKSLSLPWAVTAYLLFTAAMYAAARLWLARPAGPVVPPHLIATRA